MRKKKKTETNSHAVYTRPLTKAAAFLHLRCSKRPQELHMPALSPTMTQGNITKWKVSEGSAVSAGDSMARLEPCVIFFFGTFCPPSTSGVKPKKKQKAFRRVLTYSSFFTIQDESSQGSVKTCHTQRAPPRQRRTLRRRLR